MCICHACYKQASTNVNNPTFQPRWKPKQALPKQGGNFHLKVGGGGGGAKSSGNAGDPMLGVAVSGGSRIYKRGGGGGRGIK